MQEASDCMQAFKSKFPDHVHSHACKALVKDIEMASASKPDFGKSTVLYYGLGSSVGIATDYGLDGPGIESWWGRDFLPV